VSDRPKLSIAPTPAERALQGVTMIGIAALFAFCASVWSRLPAKVPTHFDLSGRPDAWGDRATLLALPILVVLFYVGFSFLERLPHTYNYPVPVNANNARRLYGLGRQLVLTMKLIVTGTFGYIFYNSVQVALGERVVLSLWFLPVVVVAILTSLAVAIVKMSRAAR